MTRILLTVMLVMGGRVALGLEAGSATVDISPTVFPTPVNGSMSGRFAEGVHDPMQARSLALSAGGVTQIFCVVDACMVPREMCEAVKERVVAATGVAREGLVIAATHTHSAATLTAVFQSDPDPGYVAEVPERIAASMIAAFEKRVAAELAWGLGSDPTQVFNRRWFMKGGESYENPFGGKADTALMNPGARNPKVSVPTAPVDADVGLVAVRRADTGVPLGLLANYSLHYVGGNPAISADYFGVFREEMKRRLFPAGGGEEFVALMSNGTSGDVNNINFGEPPLSLRNRKQPGEQIRVVANSVADAAMAVWEGLEWKREVALASGEGELKLGVRKASAEELDEARRVLAESKPGADGQHRDRRAIYAREALKLATYPDEVPVLLQAHRVGDLTVATIPCEVFVEIGLELKRAAPLTRHFTISLANGYNGYLPTRAAHAMGGYETWRARSSYLEVGAAERIGAELGRLLRGIAGK